MAVDITFQRQMFDTNVAQLAGSPNRSILKRTCGFKRLSGETAYVDHIGPLATWETRIGDGSSPESAKALTSIQTRRYFEDAASITAANINAMETPHVEVARQRTLLVPRIIEWGHEFNDINDMQEIIDLHGPTLQQGMRTIWGSEDYNVIAALAAATVTRGRIEGSTSNVAYSSNGLPKELDSSYAGKLTVNGVAEIAELLDGQYLPGERRFLLMSERQKRWLIQSDKETIFSNDFISMDATGAKRFETGDLPDIFGFIPIVHPQMAHTVVYAYTENALCWGEFKPLATKMAERPDHRFSKQAYMCQYFDCKRVDDKRVVQVTFASA